MEERLVMTPTPKPTEGMRRWVQRHPVVAFVALAYTVSWLTWWPALLGLGGVALIILGGLGPLVAAWVVTRHTGSSVRAWALQIIRWRVPFRYYLYALGLPPLLYGLVDVALALHGYDIDPSLLLERVPGYLATLVFVAVLGGGLEEPGWRGFALPRLQQRYTPVVATLFLGLAWGVWHVPLYGPLGFVVPMVLAFFYTWLYNRTGSVLLCILLHASFTPAQDHLVLLPDAVVEAEALGTIDFVILGTYVAAALVLVILTRGRLGRRPGANNADDGFMARNHPTVPRTAEWQKGNTP
jgi:membrane protease YdiL (CAAX protease family)